MGGLQNQFSIAPPNNVTIIIKIPKNKIVVTIQPI